MAGERERSPECIAGDAKLEAIARLLRSRFGASKRILSVGCGDGSEAAVLSDLLGAHVTGVDVVGDFDPDARRRVSLVVADARQLPFPECSFDLVFSFHALEHIPRPREAVAEMRRVLSTQGGLWIGTPNRARVVGYLGSRDASLRDKLTWNFYEWWTRAHGGFRNELGAHAGFTPDELRALLESEFDVVEDETPAYYALLYPRHRRLQAGLARIGLDRYAYPSIYFAGSRPRATAQSPPRALPQNDRTRQAGG